MEAVRLRLAWCFSPSVVLNFLRKVEVTTHYSYNIAFNCESEVFTSPHHVMQSTQHPVCSLSLATAGTSIRATVWNRKYQTWLTSGLTINRIIYVLFMCMCICVTGLQHHSRPNVCTTGIWVAFRQTQELYGLNAHLNICLFIASHCNTEQWHRTSDILLILRRSSWYLCFTSMFFSKIIVLTQHGWGSF